jgi:hypothetical protein
MHYLEWWSVGNVLILFWGNMGKGNWGDMGTWGRGIMGEDPFRKEIYQILIGKIAPNLQNFLQMPAPPKDYLLVGIAIKPNHLLP